MKKITNEMQGINQIKLIAKRTIDRSVYSLMYPAIKEGKYKLSEDDQIKSYKEDMCKKINKKLLELKYFWQKRKKKEIELLPEMQKVKYVLDDENLYKQLINSLSK